MAQYATRTPAQDERVESVAIDIANPAPTGWGAFAFTTALLGCAFASFIVPYVVDSSIRVALGAALFYGGIIQVLAGMWAFRRGQTVTATIFSSYGGFLAALAVIFIPGFGLYNVLSSASLIHPALGLLFLCWTIFSALLVIGSLRTHVAMTLTLVLLFLSYLLLTIGQLAAANGILLHIGGWLGIACALVAWYTALASMLRSANGRFMLPVGRVESEI